MSNDTTTPEQAARDMLERIGLPDAQTLTAGDVIELANAVADAWRYRRLLQALPLVARGDIEIHPGRVSRWGVVEGLKNFSHDDTPDGIATAISAAYDAQVKR